MDFADPQRLAGFTVRGGTLDGRTTLDVDHRFRPFLGEIEPGLLRASPFVSDIRSARVVYGYFDGRFSELTLVELETGATTVVHTTNDVIHSAALAADGTIYFLALDPATREERGIYRGRIAGLTSAAVRGFELVLDPERRDPSQPRLWC